MSSTQKEIEKIAADVYEARAADRTGKYDDQLELAFDRAFSKPGNAVEYAPAVASAVVDWVRECIEDEADGLIAGFDALGIEPEPWANEVLKASAEQVLSEGLSNASKTLEIQKQRLQRFQNVDSYVRGRIHSAKNTALRSALDKLREHRLGPEPAAEKPVSFSAHRKRFLELKNEGVHVYALNRHANAEPFGPWRIGCDQGDSNTKSHVRERFRSAARAAAVAAGAPPRANLVDWWTSQLANGKPRFIQGLLDLSVVYCERLESNAIELRPLVSGETGKPGLSRDRYPSGELVPYWLYDEPHVPLNDINEEYRYWQNHIWAGFDSSVAEVASWRSRGRAWIDNDGIRYVESREETRERVGKRVRLRTDFLDAQIIGLSYDIAVLEANHAIDQGLLSATRTFEAIVPQWVASIERAWATSSKTLGLSWKKRQLLGVDIEKPFREVGADLAYFVQHQGALTSYGLEAEPARPVEVGLETTLRDLERLLSKPEALAQFFEVLGRNESPTLRALVDRTHAAISDTTLQPASIPSGQAMGGVRVDDSETALLEILRLVAGHPSLRILASETQSPPKVSLGERLRALEARIPDRKLQKMAVAVTRYQAYFRDLRQLKSAAKSYQTPALLKERYPELEVWGVLEKDDVLSIAEDDFHSSRFAWSLVKRQLGFRGNDDRTLKNYRKRLKTAGIQL